jgi:hypothetical protein
VCRGDAGGDSDECRYRVCCTNRYLYPLEVAPLPQSQLADSGLGCLNEQVRACVVLKRSAGRKLVVCVVT